MKFYVASRFGNKKEVREIYRKLAANGHEITKDWTKHKQTKPYIKNQTLSSQYASVDIDGVRESEVFLLISDENGSGMFVELGAAILSKILHGKPEIYVVGEHNSRSLFFFHPLVNRRDTVEDVLKELK